MILIKIIMKIHSIIINKKVIYKIFKKVIQKNKFNKSNKKYKILQ